MDGVTPTPPSTEPTRDMTQLETLAVNRKAKKAVEGHKELATLNEQERMQLQMKEYEKITGVPYPALSTPARVALKNQGQVEAAVSEFIDEAKASLGLPKYDDGTFRIMPEPTPPAPMPTRPRNSGREA